MLGAYVRIFTASYSRFFIRLSVCHFDKSSHNLSAAQPFVYHLSASQYDEDPVCFRRMISYLQLKDLLGTRAANHVRKYRTH